MALESRWQGTNTLFNCYAQQVTLIHPKYIVCHLCLFHEIIPFLLGIKNHMQPWKALITCFINSQGCLFSRSRISKANSPGRENIRDNLVSRYQPKSNASTAFTFSCSCLSKFQEATETGISSFLQFLCGSFALYLIHWVLGLGKREMVILQHFLSLPLLITVFHQVAGRVPFDEFLLFGGPLLSHPHNLHI